MITSILSRYLLKKIVTVTLITLLAVTLLLFFVQSTKYLDLVISKGLKITYLIHISLLTMPSMFNELLPITIFLSTIVSWQILINNNEIIIMETTGLSPWQISKPIICLGLVSALVCFIFSLFIVNTAYIQFVKLRDEIRNNLNLRILGSNKFIQINKDITIYIEAADKTNLLKNILIYNITNNNDYAIYAEQARILNQNNKIKILLQKGSIQKLNKLDKTVNFINFDFYVLDIPEMNKQNHAYERVGSKNLYLWELVFYNKLPFIQKLKKQDYAAYKAKVNSYILEINKRCVNIILSIALSCIVAYFYSNHKFSRNTHFLPLFNSLLSGILLKIYVISVLINTFNLFIIISSYIAISIMVLYMLLRIRLL